MALPQPEQLTDRPPVGRNIDELLGELAIPREEIKRTAPGDMPGGNAPTGSDLSFENEPADAMPDEVAQLSGKTIANTVDTTFGTGFSLYAKNTTPEKYQANEKQMANLENAWTAVAKNMNWRVEDSPWFNVIILTIAVYLPHFQEAKTDRRFAEHEERLKALENNARLQAPETKPAA